MHRLRITGLITICLLVAVLSLREMSQLRYPSTMLPNLPSSLDQLVSVTGVIKMMKQETVYPICWLWDTEDLW